MADAGRPTTVVVDPATPVGAGSGLAGPSLVKCYNLATVRQRHVLHVIGHLSNAILRQVNDALRAALELPERRSRGGAWGRFWAAGVGRTPAKNKTAAQYLPQAHLVQPQAPARKGEGGVQPFTCP